MMNQMNQLIEAFRVLIFELVTVMCLKKIILFSDRKQNYRFKVEAVKRCGHTLQHLSKSLRNDKRLVLTAVKQNGFALVHASKSLQNNREVVMAAVNQKGCALIHASTALKNDKEIILVAVKKSEGVALMHASMSVKSDRAFVLLLMSHSGHALRYVPESLKNDKQVVLAAVKQNCEAFKFAPYTLKTDLEILMEAILAASKASEDIAHRMHGILDPKFVIETLQNEASKLRRNIVCFAFSIGLPWEYGMRKIVENNPDDYRAVDEKTGLYPFMLAATSCHADANVDRMYEVLILCPDVLQSDP